MKSLFIAFVLLSGCVANDNKEVVLKKQSLNINDTVKVQGVASNNRSLEISNEPMDKLKILCGKVCVNLPADFELMSREVLETKYPSGNRPTIVYTNKEGSINFAFNHTKNRILIEQLPEALQAFVKQFNSLYPQIKWLKKEITTINSNKFIVLEFISPAIDTSIYNLMYITSLDEKVLMCGFNCIETQITEWELKAKETLNSIEIK